MDDITRDQATNYIQELMKVYFKGSVPFSFLRLEQYIRQLEKNTLYYAPLYNLYKEKAFLIEQLYVCQDDRQINVSQMKENSELFKRLENVLKQIKEIEKE